MWFISRTYSIRDLTKLKGILYSHMLQVFPKIGKGSCESHIVLKGFSWEVTQVREHFSYISLSKPVM